MNFHTFYVYSSCMLEERICIHLQLSFWIANCVSFMSIWLALFPLPNGRKIPDKNFSPTAEQALICIHSRPLILDSQLQFSVSFSSLCWHKHDMEMKTQKGMKVIIMLMMKRLRWFFFSSLRHGPTRLTSYNVSFFLDTKISLVQAKTIFPFYFRI